MLNKKGQSEDVSEYLLVTIAIIVGIVILTMGHNYKEFSVDQAMQNLNPGVTEIQSYDSSFIATDLKNILDLQVSEDSTFAELLSQISNNQFESNLLKKPLVASHYICSDNLLNIINEQLDPVYFNHWIIQVYSEDKLLFSCKPSEIDFSLLSSTTMIIPSSDPKVNLNVKLEVYE